jgi:hypothetical protein
VSSAQHAPVANALAATVSTSPVKSTHRRSSSLRLCDWPIAVTAARTLIPAPDPPDTSPAAPYGGPDSLNDHRAERHPLTGPQLRVRGSRWSVLVALWPPVPGRTGARCAK